MYHPYFVRIDKICYRSSPFGFKAYLSALKVFYIAKPHKRHKESSFLLEIACIEFVIFKLLKSAV